jgi:hypothetical protein
MLSPWAQFIEYKITRLPLSVMTAVTEFSSRQSTLVSQKLKAFKHIKLFL